jgi:putative colanic acid biosynthesis UDP-glucose lipid carrier transferase
MGAYQTVWESAYTTACCLAVALYLLLAEFNGLYRLTYNVRVASEAALIGTAWCVTVGGLLALAFASKTTGQYSRVTVTLWATAAPVCIAGFRLMLRAMLKNLRTRGYFTQTVAVVGCTRVAEKLLQSFRDDPTLGMVVQGVYEDRAQPRRYAPVEQLAEVRGNFQTLVEDARDGKLDIVYIALPLRAELRSNEIVRKLADTTATVYFVPDIFGFDLLHARWNTVGSISVVSIFDTPFRGFGGWIKRLEDIVLGLVALLMVSPVMLVVAAGVLITSPGPVFFRQRRYGLSGREIHVFKFRTMTVCEDGPNVQQAQKNDKRITPLGAFLRRTSLDELPQLFNVVGGSMSLVGPRPHAVAHNEHYRKMIQGYMLRHKVKPGITGWAQVHGWRGETETIDKMEHRVAHDLYYIHNWKLSLDIKILFLTVFGRGTRMNAR